MKKPLFFIASIFISGTILAQPTLTANDLNMSIGVTYPMAQCQYLNPGPGGANVTWDFSAFTSSGAYNSVASAANSNFPNSNITVAGGGTEVYNDQNNNGIFTWGIDANGTIITYTDPSQTMFYPLTMNGSATNTFEATFTSGVQFTRAGNETLTCDGYGTVITPNGTYTDALRLHTQQNYSDTYSGGQIDYVVNVYAWYIAGYPNAIASVSEIVMDNGQPTQYGFYSTDPIASLLTEENKEFGLYPNPATDLLNFKSVNDQTIESVQVINSLGVVVLNSVEKTSINKLKIDVSNLQFGVYFIRLKGENGVLRQRKFVKK